ncbi:alpha-glucosidase MalA [Sulfurisphaera javensis]|uniref:Alpha-glucosidase MalA n=2 Tax=Sulfurisphaera javensis TaxID=2049879 RepID=A0AAT9GMX0_9CREN
MQVEEKDGIYRIRINNPLPPVEFNFQGVNSSKSLHDFNLTIEEKENSLIISKPLELEEHIVGLGEKAVELDRRRFRFRMCNIDAGKYFKFSDPLYINIPFFISVYKGKATGYFINSASCDLVIDIGVSDYSKIKIFVPHRDVELFIFEGPTIEKVLERYTDVTGKPYLMPEWALGYMISRYSYYPQDYIIKLVDLMKEFRVTAVFLDIDFMDSFKLFTWDKEKFPDPQKFIEELHKRGVKLITIVDHSVRADQKYPIFISGLGKFCETGKGELFVGKLWPGNTVYPDFFKEETRKWWSELIYNWLKQGVDGIWLDMNEPTDFTTYDTYYEILNQLHATMKDERLLLTFPPNVVHEYKGKKVPHLMIRNAYPLYEAMATFEGFKDKEPFILSRSGYAGIQKYACVWTGDNTPSWDDLKLQLQLVLGLSISGVSCVGIDIGAFQGRGSRDIDNSPELLVKYFGIALFFPFFRTHKATNGIDTEPIFLPSYYREKMKKIIDTRYKFLPYLYSLAIESHETGHPIIRPLFYDFQEDENTYRIEDEYMVGKFLLYAPIITPTERRLVYLPSGRWMEFWTKEIFEGNSWINSSSDLPIYIREGSIIPLENNDILTFGNYGKFKYNNVFIEREGNLLKLSKPFFVRKIITEKKEIEVNKELTSIDL